jgi:prolyl-tRNA synthetase
MTRLGQYERLYEEVLAIPVLRGRKPAHDKFPGADTTTTVEALMPDGRSVQGGTSHYLGTSFAEAFEIRYADEDERERLAHTTSWGLSWRAIGALVMTHSDDQGLVLPPSVAPEQVVVVPIWRDETRGAVREYAADIAEDLDEAGLRVVYDDWEDRYLGFNFNDLELLGFPLRAEVGPNEVSDETVTLVHRPDGERVVEDRSSLAETVEEHLDVIYQKLYEAAEENLEENVRAASSREEILGTIGRHGGYVRAAWCGDESCEEPIKEAIAADIVMVPLDEDEAPIEDECAICGEAATETAYFAKSY